MTGRLADISARLEGICQLGTVVNAMTGMAAARARQAHQQIISVDSYAATFTAAMGQIMAPIATPPVRQSAHPDPALLVFCAEQGFAGAFSERVIDAIGEDPGVRNLFLIGTRGKVILAERGITPLWSAAMPSHSPGIPKFADTILRAIYQRIDAGGIDRLDALYTTWQSGVPTVARRRLFPIDLPSLPVREGDAPLTNLPDLALISSLSADYFHALICNVALYAFAAENEARMAAMSSAQNQIERELTELAAIERRVRQESITAEIIELATGNRASREAASRS